MIRIPEPELMDDMDQALAYDAADFSRAHNRRVDIFRELAPPQALTGSTLDLGCGSGDLDFRILSALPEISILGVDGAQAMIDLANKRATQDPQLKGRVSFICRFIPSEDLPLGPWQTIMSNSFLHHLHDPQILWRTIKQLAVPDTYIFVSDLRRPDNSNEAQRIVNDLAGDEAEVLKSDFYNSLLAAFEVAEVEQQLALARIKGLRVSQLDDIHLTVTGFIKG
jgi:SAM-dependent methyltransferase